MPKGIKITKEESEKLSKMFHTMRIKDIAKEVGRSFGSVWSHLYRKGHRRIWIEQNPLKMPDLTKTQLAYIAGLIDGEGTINIRKRYSGKGRWKPEVRISGTSLILMNWLMSTINSKNTWIEKRQGSFNHSVSYMFHFQGISFLPFYEALEPYMIIKRNHMRLIILWSKERLKQKKQELLSKKQIKITEVLTIMNYKPLKISEEEKLKIYQSIT